MPISAKAYQRRPTRHWTIRRKRLLTPGRPATIPDMTMAAMSGPKSPGVVRTRMSGCGKGRREYGRLDARPQAELGEDLLGEPGDHAALGGVRHVDDEVLNALVGVLLDDLGDPIGVAVERVPLADV